MDVDKWDLFLTSWLNQIKDLRILDGIYNINEKKLINIMSQT